MSEWETTDMFKRLGFFAVSLASLALVLSVVAPAFAASATSSFTVTASVAANCSISTTTIAFGAYDPVVAQAASPLDGTGSVTITCTKGAVTTIGLNAGGNGASALGTTRAMADGSGNFLSYEIYQNAARNVFWGNSGADLFAPPVAPSKAPRTFSTFGRIPAAQDVPAGSYTDTVTATVNF